MSKRDEYIAKYAAKFEEVTGSEPDMDLLTKVVIGLGPSIYNADAETVASSDDGEMETVKKNFLIGKLGLEDNDALTAGLDKVIDAYGRSNPKKFRAILYYMLAKEFGKEGVYDA